MSSPHFDWWCNATRMIRNYPARKQEHDDLQSQKVTADLSGMPCGGSSGRTTENIALREMAPAKQQEYEAVRKAIDITSMLPNGDIRMKLIKKVYWGEKHCPIESVVYDLYISRQTAKNWHRAFVYLVGECFGYVL